MAFLHQANWLQMKRKNGGVTFGRVIKALESEEGLKYFIGHGRGYVQNALGRQKMSCIFSSGADVWLGAGDRFIAVDNDRRYHNQPAYSEIFSFNTVPTISTTPAWVFGGPAVGTKYRIESEDYHFVFNNSSFSTIYLDFYSFCPRRDIFSTEETLNGLMQDVDNYAGVGDVSTGGVFDTSDANNLFQYPLTREVEGVTPYDNRGLTADYKIRFQGHRVMEPGTNFEWAYHKGRYTYEVPDALSPVPAYAKNRFESVYVRIRGEPIKATVSAAQDVTTAIGKLQWTYDYRIKWHYPLQANREAVTVRQQDLAESSAGVRPVPPGGALPTAPLQVLAGGHDPDAAGSTPAGYTPAVV